ncbi:hypothetical protein STVIR_2715 [Streptomyces viridochromogenes Tue57]|uniref:Uncharacterized protein n=1 Tax=Streptomyces viridochromogenes Tue57 TaxID=1160705 RepID=L8PLQ5_STRVR|nr:hypothetical protein STVIR_2715 [Streptomyces viridochromogenes Tue57]
MHIDDLPQWWLTELLPGRLKSAIPGTAARGAILTTAAPEKRRKETLDA